MKYYITSKIDNKKIEVTRNEALDFLQKNYTENVCSFSDMLNSENIYPGSFTFLEVKEE